MMFLKGVPHNTSYYSKILCPTFFTLHLYTSIGEPKKKKSLKIKIKDLNPSIKSTRQMKTQVARTQTKANNQPKKKSSKKTKRRPYAKRIHGYEMIINHKKKT